MAGDRTDPVTRGHGRAHWLPDVLRDAGLPVDVVPGWADAGKEPREWVAIVDHHTASSQRGGPRAALGTVTRGRPDVPGPLANLLLDRAGVHVVVASGAANHPGVAYLPLRGGISSGVKYWALGREIELDGVGEPYPAEGRQYEAMTRGNAAICAYLGLDPAAGLWDHKSVCRPVGRKIDVRPYDLADGRVRVARRLTPPAKPAPTPKPTPTPTPNGGLTMADITTLTRKLDELGRGIMTVADQQTQLAQAVERVGRGVLIVAAQDADLAREHQADLAAIAASLDALTGPG